MYEGVSQTQNTLLHYMTHILEFKDTRGGIHVWHYLFLHVASCFQYTGINLALRILIVDDIQMVRTKLSTFIQCEIIKVIMCQAEEEMWSWKSVLLSWNNLS